LKRNIVRIDEDKCNGCGLCVPSCAEGAIQIIDGKARLVSDKYCDGLGACLGECPQNAISIEERDADAFDEDAAKEHVARTREVKDALACGCPGSWARSLSPQAAPAEAAHDAPPSQLGHWPVQLHLVPTNAPYLTNADLLLAADCVPFAMADFHTRFLRGRPVVVGCPKLDDAQYYVEKLTEILKRNDVHSLTVVHMEVPCCSGLSRIAAAAVRASGADIPVSDVTISIGGQVLAECAAGF